MIMLTDDERKLLHKCHSHIGYAVASPKAGVSHLAQSQAGGAGGGFQYQVGGGALTGNWRRFEVVESTSGGGRTLRFSEPHLCVSITMKRLQQWASGLPAELRERAQVAWATYPVNTRNLNDLEAIVHEGIDLSAPAEQLELFEVA
ncbi:hypothetical protein CH296_11100 [Rhodococcus sp. 14-2496-1d]|uniref:hypothetical protein n=1 Tax=Rhodococcus sp. 14-2496-1d TaxID=2023146 RepID=UPI000B9AAB09|nr:hypothetical protein [Rhodococcus sp. 14-2496-1d]OZF33175.1 hypothetical protein CH296_11100 [Rhodococcus sp. 14-2496-1d]